eukprot:4537685-Prorocentrum_lima.AAC.1
MKEVYGDPSHGRIPGINLDAILYADDTALASNSSRSLQALLQSIQTVGIEYGMQLNQLKCELIRFNSALSVRFLDGTLVKAVEQA